MKKELTDNELIYKIQKFNDKEAIDLLLYRYEDEIKKLVRGRLSKTFKFYYDYDEFEQLVRFATLKVIKTYDSSKGTFHNYWSSSANRIITTELRRISKKLSGVEVNQVFTFNEEETDIMESFSNDSTIFKRKIDATYDLERIKKISDEILTLEEKAILAYKMIGYSYNEIAQKIKSTPKRVDNAMLIIRRKLKKYL